MGKVYDFKTVEKKWQDKWEKAKIFEVKEDKKKKKFYALDMFPYPSGEGLHMGHAFVFSLGDIFARFKRLQGYNVLYPVGYDSLGLPAENAAIKKGIHPEEYTKKSIANFAKQQRAMGWSYDWSRVLKTSDPDFYEWDQWIFLQMLKRGLAYKKKSAVNWCPKCQTVLANEQVVGGKCWRHEDTSVEIKQLEQWYFKITNYAEELLQGLDKLDWSENAKTRQRNWIGKSLGTEINFEVNGEKWPVFTTRPDTIFGVTFVVVSAQHTKLMSLVTPEKKKDVDSFMKKIKSVSEKELEFLEKEGVFTGSYATNPLTKEKVPIYAGNFVVADYGSGMVMGVPAHDQRDFDFAKKYKIPIKVVVKSNGADYLVVEKSLKIGAQKQLKDFGVVTIKEIDKDWGKFFLISVKEDKENEFIKFLEKNLEKQNPDGGSWYTDSMGTTNNVILSNKTFHVTDEKPLEEFKKYGRKLNIPEKQLDIEIKAYTGFGTLINSGDFNGLTSDEAKIHITKWLETKKLGKGVVNYKLRDWLISRQRYWGTPIPIVYCKECGAVPVPEKELPVKLPKEIKFGKGNPLETNEKWINVKCPKCGKKGRRETDTMDTFVNSSWYFLRYTDSKNANKIFDSSKANYWCPVDQYIGGPEHITMHLIYIRFYTKFFRDLGLINFDEPALRYFTQGIVKGEDGDRMSKSKGNIVEPQETVANYGADALRLYLISASSPDSDFDWDAKGIQSSFKFLNKVYDYFYGFKSSKSDERVESRVNKTIKEVTMLIQDFKYNLAIIKIRELFDYLSEKKFDKKTAETFVKLLHPFCPHITEELWGDLGNKPFISLQSWPQVEEKKINEAFEKEDKMIDEIISDTLNVVRIVKEKGQSPVRLYLYVIPKDLDSCATHAEEIEKRTGLMTKVYTVNDPKRHDPENKAKKAKLGKPGIYLE